MESKNTKVVEQTKIRYKIYSVQAGGLSKLGGKKEFNTLEEVDEYIEKYRSIKHHARYRNEYYSQLAVQEYTEKYKATIIKLIDEI